MSETSHEEHVSIICEQGSSYFGNVFQIHFLNASQREVWISTVWKSADATKSLSSLNGMAELFNSLKHYYKKRCNCCCAYYMLTRSHPLRHLLLHLDEITKGRKGFSRPIEKSLPVYSELHIASY